MRGKNSRGSWKGAVEFSYPNLPGRSDELGQHRPLRWPSDTENAADKVDTRYPTLKHELSTFRELAVEIELDISFVVPPDNEATLTKLLRAPPGSTAEFVMGLCMKEAENDGIQMIEDLKLEWKQGQRVWMPFKTLVDLTPETIRKQWLMKTNLMGGMCARRIDLAERDLQVYWENRGIEQPPIREICTWRTWMQMNAKSNDQVLSNSSLVPLPSTLATRKGRLQAATLLAVLNGQKLMCRFRRAPFHEEVKNASLPSSIKIQEQRRQFEATSEDTCRVTRGKYLVTGTFPDIEVEFRWRAADPRFPRSVPRHIPTFPRGYMDQQQ